MQGIWILVGVAGMVLAVPLAAVVLVSMASMREESAQSLSGMPPGPITRLARRVLAYQSEPFDTSAHGRARRSASTGPGRRPAGRRTTGRTGQEVRFAYARRTLPDPGQYPASRQSGPGAVRFDDRQTAGV